jgi:hypothetical protein
MTANDRALSLDVLAAGLTGAAYPIALQKGITGLWIDLEMELWIVLVETVSRWGRSFSQAEWPSTFAAWKEHILEELTDAAYQTILRFGIQGSFLDVELGLYQAFRSVIEDIGQDLVVRALALETSYIVIRSRASTKPRVHDLV